jgi:hypothetical protein
MVNPPLALAGRFTAPPGDAAAFVSRPAQDTMDILGQPRHLLHVHKCQLPVQGEVVMCVHAAFCLMALLRP